MNGVWTAPVSAALALWLVRLLLAGAAVTVLAHVLGATLARQSAATRVVVWRAAVLALLLVPWASLALPWHWTVPANAAVTRWVAAATLPESAARPGGAGLPHAPGTPVGDGEVAPRGDGTGGRTGVGSWAGTGSRAGTWAGAGGTAAVSVPDARVPGRWALARGIRSVEPGVLFALLWAGVALGFLFYLVAGLLALRAHARRARDVTGAVSQLLSPLGPAPCARGPVRPVRPVRVLRGGPFRVPVCWGVLHPTVLLPSGSEAWTRARTRAVLLHETTHVERGDALFLLLARAACALHWLNPLAWTVQRRLSLDAEMACDAAVLEKGIPPREYVRTLLDVAAEARRRARPGLSLALVPVGSLTWRVTRILDARPLASAHRALSTAAAAALMTVALAGATASLAPDAAPVADSRAAAMAGSAAGATASSGADGAAAAFGSSEHRRPAAPLAFAAPGGWPPALAAPGGPPPALAGPGGPLPVFATPGRSPLAFAGPGGPPPAPDAAAGVGVSAPAHTPTDAPAAGRGFTQGSAAGPSILAEAPRILEVETAAGAAVPGPSSVAAGGPAQERAEAPSALAEAPPILEVGTVAGAPGSQGAASLERTAALPFRGIEPREVAPRLGATIPPAPRPRSAAPAVPERVAAVAQRFQAQGSAYRAEQLASTAAPNVVEFLVDELDWIPWRCSGSGASTQCILGKNGQPVTVPVYIDDRPMMVGLDALLKRSPREFYQIEVAGAVRAYTHRHVLELVARAEEAALPTPGRASF